MKNTTIYTYELLLKINLCNTAKFRRKGTVYALLTGMLAVGLIVSDLLIENFHTGYAGMLFLTCSLVTVVALIKNRRSKIAAAVQKQVQENPNKTVEYQFDENTVTAKQTSDKIQSETRIEYSYIATVIKTDERSFYFVTKNNLMYALYDENGIGELFSYLSSKTKQ